MKYSVVFKFLAVLLCACFLFAALGAALGIIAAAAAGLYSNTVEELKLQSMDSSLRGVASRLAEHCAAAELSNCPETFLDQYIGEYHPYQLTTDESLWFYTVEDESGTVLESRYDAAMVVGAEKLEYLIAPTYPVVLDYETVEHGTGKVTEVTRPGFDPTQETFAPSPGGMNYLHIETISFEDDDGVTHKYRLGICEGPVYLVTIYLLPGAYAYEDHWSWDLAQLGYTHRYNMLWVLGASLLLLAAGLVYLCCAAGRSPRRTELKPGGLNRIPLDLYAAGLCLAVAGIVSVVVDVVNWHIDYFDPAWLLVLAICALAFVGCLLVTGFLFACAAQFKMPEGYWLRHSLVGLCTVGGAKLLMAVLRWLGKKLPVLFGGIKKLLLWIWMLVKKLFSFVFGLIGRFFSALWRGLRRFAQLLPLTWQWLLVAFTMVFVLLICLTIPDVRWQLMGVAVCIAIVMYGAHCFGILLESTKRMSQGDLNTQVDDKLLLGSFREYAAHLNALAGVAVEAARKQMKSERMKAELVTNVSHDIKTPLTSIINYVDLLQKAQTQEEAQTYLEVLARQSQRLKKLIEDLMEMSKASTGNMAVDLTLMDAGEAINQALGEFSEKLELAELTPVFNAPEEPVMIMADGRLTWRVLSNLLSNAVKYALPGTRLYIDLISLDGKVLISLKNISKEQLNVKADELMERFVRGDASRNTEGSGLGLNIARSLMELQKGRLQLLVDGDLFKATLVFPAD